MLVSLYIALALITILAIIFIALFLKANTKLVENQQSANDHGKLLTEADTKITFHREQIEKLENEIAILEDSIRLVEAARNKTETEKQLVMQQNDQLKQQMNDWEETKRKHLEASKASMLEISNQLSSKLLEDHKRETNQVKKEFEDNFKKTSEEFGKNYQSVFEAVKVLNDQVRESKTSSDLIKNALLHPTGAGNLAEITLENIFKASGLIENRDYFMQASFTNDGSTKRPDAIVYLPGGGILAVDSKTSVHFARGANPANDEERKMHDNNLKAAINEQLRGLTQRDYKKFIETYLERENKDYSEKNIVIAMFLPSDVAFEKVITADGSFYEKACKEKIVPVGPSGLISLLLQSKLVIDRNRQEKNYEVILNEVKKLINSVAILQGFAAGLGKSLNSTVKKYNDFASSFNGNFSIKAKKITELGVKDDKEIGFEPIPRLISEIEDSSN